MKSLIFFLSIFLPVSITYSEDINNMDLRPGDAGYKPSLIRTMDLRPGDVGYKPSSKNNNYDIHKAACKGDTKRIVQLVKAGVNPDLRDKDGDTPLLESIKCKQNIVNFLTSRSTKYKRNTKEIPYFNKQVKALIFSLKTRMAKVSCT